MRKQPFNSQGLGMVPEPERIRLWGGGKLCNEDKAQSKSSSFHLEMIAVTWPAPIWWGRKGDEHVSRPSRCQGIQVSGRGAMGEGLV